MNIEREESLNYPIRQTQEEYYEEEPIGFSDFQAFANQTEEEPMEYEEEEQQQQYEPQYEEQVFQENLSEYQISKRKSAALGELRQFQNEGVNVSPNLNMNTDLFVLEQEVQIIKANIKRQSTLEMSRFFLLFGVGFIESATTKFDPHTPLKGWRSSMEKKITTFDDVLMDVYERYGPTMANWNPLFVLAFLVAINGVTHVMSSGSQIPDFTSAINNLKSDTEVSGPSDEAMQLFNQLDNDVIAKPKRKYTKKNK